MSATNDKWSRSMRVGAICSAFLILLSVLYQSIRTDEHDTLGSARNDSNASLTVADPSEPNGSPDLADSHQEREFVLPFVGLVRADRTSTETFQVPTSDGRVLPMEGRIFLNRDGAWLRVEYNRPGSQVVHRPPAALEERYEGRNEKITGLWTSHSSMTIDAALRKVSEVIDLSKASHCSITKAKMIMGETDKPSSALLVEVFGVRTSSERIPDEEIYRRVRLVVDLDWDVIYEDDVL